MALPKCQCNADHCNNTVVRTVLTATSQSKGKGQNSMQLVLEQAWCYYIQGWSSTSCIEFCWWYRLRHGPVIHGLQNGGGLFMSDAKTICFLVVVFLINL